MENLHQISHLWICQASMVGMRPLAASSGWSSGVVSAGNWNHWQFATWNWRGRVEVYLWPEGPDVSRKFLEKVVSDGVLAVWIFLRFGRSDGFGDAYFPEMQGKVGTRRIMIHDPTLPLTVLTVKSNPSHLVVRKIYNFAALPYMASWLFPRKCTVSPLRLNILENSLRIPEHGTHPGPHALCWWWLAQLAKRRTSRTTRHPILRRTYPPCN